MQSVALDIGRVEFLYHNLSMHRRPVVYYNCAK